MCWQFVWEQECVMSAKQIFSFLLSDVCCCLLTTKIMPPISLWQFKKEEYGISCKLLRRKTKLPWCMYKIYNYSFNLKIRHENDEAKQVYEITCNLLRNPRTRVPGAMLKATCTLLSRSPFFLLFLFFSFFFFL